MTLIKLVYLIRVPLECYFQSLYICRLPLFKSDLYEGL